MMVAAARVGVPVVALLMVGLAAGLQVQLDPWGDDSIRVRIAPPGLGMSDPPIRGLLPTPPASATPVTRSPPGDAPETLTNGNLLVAVDPSTGLVTATRRSDGAVLLEQIAMVFSAPEVVTTVPNSMASTVVFRGHGASERVYGFGEHRTGQVNQMPFTKEFSDSQIYDISHGSDVTIPWYASSLGYGFLWDLPSFGNVSVSGDAIAWHSQASVVVDFWITTTSGTPNSTVSPFRDLLKHFVDAVGHAPTMPYYATGFIQCKNRCGLRRVG